MPVLQKEVDVTVEDGTKINDNFRIFDSSSKKFWFSYCYHLTKAFNKALFECFDEIKESGILNISYSHSYSNSAATAAASNSAYITLARFSVFGDTFNVFVSNNYTGTNTGASYQIIRPIVIRSYETLPDYGIVREPYNISSATTDCWYGNYAKLTDNTNINRLCFKFIIHYNADFIDIAYENTTINTGSSSYNKQLLPICTIIKGTSVTARDALYYSFNCNFQIGSTFHRLVFTDDLKNTYLGDTYNDINYTIASTSFTSSYLFNVITSSHTHIKNILPLNDSTKIELYKPICCNGLIQFSDNIMCPVDTSKVSTGSYYIIGDDTFYCPGVIMGSKYSLPIRVLLLKI